VEVTSRQVWPQRLTLSILVTNSERGSVGADPTVAVVAESATLAPLFGVAVAVGTWDISSPESANSAGPTTNTVAPPAATRIAKRTAASRVTLPHPQRVGR
jgi:hypothetical protein